MTTRRRLRNRYDPPAAEPEAVSVQPVSPFPAPPDTGEEPAVAPVQANGPAVDSAAAPAIPAAPSETTPKLERPRRRFGFLFMIVLASIAFVTGLLVFNNLV